jgi:predicted DNA-binding transcriptional regulator YafY
MEISGWQDLKKWILSYGPDAKVLKPKKMVEEIISDLKKIIQNYKTS